MTLLARIQLARLDNAGFQERVFDSIAGDDQRPGSNGFDHLEMRTLLAHNKEYIRAGFI